MKTQLLQDIGESGAAAAPPRAQVWRGARQPEAPQPMLPERPELPNAVHALDEPIFTWSEPEPEAGAAHERAFAPPRSAPWRRRAAGVAALMVAAGLLGGAGWWLTQQRQVDSSLALLAQATAPVAAIPAPAPAPAPAASPPPAPAPEREPEREPEPDPTPVPAPPAEPAAVAQVAAAAAVAAAVAPPPAAKPKTTARRTDPNRRASAPAIKLSKKTLTLCRAAGYHARQCQQRRCQSTKHGLVCRG